MPAEAIKTTIDLEPIKPLPSEVLFENPNIAWHGLRSYDFAGLEAILQQGLKPYKVQEDHSVCLSANPCNASRNNVESRSFYQYTFSGGGLSLAVELARPMVSSGSTRQFDDEIRLPSIKPDKIAGIMLPAGAVDVKVSDLSSTQEARKPQHSVSYIERTLTHLSALGNEIDPASQSVIDDAMAVSVAGITLDRDQACLLEKTIMKLYSQSLSDSLGIESPTLGHMLKYITTSIPGQEIKVFEYTEDQKREVVAENERIAVQKQAAGLGSMASSSLISH